MDYWQTDKFVQYLVFLNELALHDQLERDNFFKILNESLSVFSESTQTSTILPILISAVSYSPSSNLLTSILQVGKKLEEKEFVRIIFPLLISLLDSQDKQIRISLLSQFDLIVPYIEKKKLSIQKFSQVLFLVYQIHLHS